MSADESIDLLQTLISAHGPGGQEDEVRCVVRGLWRAAGLEPVEDDGGNLYARLGKPGGSGPRLVLMSHLDEISMLVTAVEPDGRLRLTNLGGSLPWKYGEGPLDLLAPTDYAAAAKRDDYRVPTVRGILSVGSTHTGVGPLGELKDKRALTWDLVRVETGYSKDELARRGIGVGSRAVVARERKKVERLGSGTGPRARVGCFIYDDRAGLAVLTLLARKLARVKLPGEIYLGATMGEEGGLTGCTRLCRNLQPEVAVGVDTSPSVPESPLALDGTPALWMRERAATHSLREAARFDAAAARVKLKLQRAIYPSAASDAGAVLATGLAGRVLTFGLPRDNSHGFELAHPLLLGNAARVIEAYLKG